MKHIAFTGWGSGWHIMPIASLIEYGLQDTEIAHQCKLFRFGEADSLEEQICSHFPEITFVAIPAGKLRRYRTPKAILQNIQDIRKSIVGIFVSVQQLKKQRITHLFCKWWYVALPVSLAAYLLRIPLSVHESDTYVGMTNRLIAKVAFHTFVWFPGVLLPSRHIWQLLSPRLLTPDETFLPELHDSTKPIILVMGGSQGAWRLFDWLIAYLTTTESILFHFIVLLWSRNEEYKKTLSAFEQVTVCWFISSPEQMATVYQYADISITRGSATSLAEQQLFGIKKIIVPTPYTGGNHQRYNGLRYRDTYGDLLVEQNEQVDQTLTNMLDSQKRSKKTIRHPDQQVLETPLKIVWEGLLSH